MGRELPVHLHQHELVEAGGSDGVLRLLKLSCVFECFVLFHIPYNCVVLVIVFGIV